MLCPWLVTEKASKNSGRFHKGIALATWATSARDGPEGRRKHGEIGGRFEGGIVNLLHSNSAFLESPIYWMEGPEMEDIDANVAGLMLDHAGSIV